MTDKKISELTSITGASVSDANDVLPIVDTSAATTKKITRAELFKSVSALSVDGNITVGGTVDGRDVASDGTKLDGIEAGADVTDATNVKAAGALMDSEVTNLAAVKAFDPTDYVPQTSATGSADIPAGTEAQRDGTPSAGYFRFNTDSSSFEGYDGTAWGAIGGGSADLSAVDQDILPDADSTRDIGNTSKRWAQGWFDDVISGGVYLGGTGAANYLDDYEEGTFTPVIADAPSGGNEGSAADAYGHYTKIGRQVTVQITFVNIVTTGLTGASDLHITGLPFSAASLAGPNNFTGAMSAARITSTADVVVPEITNSTSYVRLREGFLSDSGSDWLLVSELSSGTADLNITLTYFAT